ncbi:MAG TPA: PEP-CTERM sorting domain-containing protein [Gemmatimonadales bacterium]
MSRIALAVLGGAALPLTTFLASPAAAQSGGTLVVSGVADATELGSPGVLLEFVRHVRVDPTANSGIFSHLNSSGGEGAAGSMETITVGVGPQSTHRVLHVGGYAFDLSFLPSGPYGQDECYVAPEVGQRCTPYQLPGDDLSPFYLENVAAAGSDAMFTAIVSFDMAGTVTGRGQTYDFSGTITATFEGVSFQEALMGLEQYGLRDVPFTGTFVLGAGRRTVNATMLSSTNATVAPEPSTAILVAAGLAGIAGVARRRQRRHG